MRDYLSPAKKMVARVIPHPAAARAFIMKRRALVFAMAAASIFVLTLGVITVRAITTPKAAVEANNTVVSEGKTSTLSTTKVESSNETEQPTMNQQHSQQSNDTSSSSTTDTTVTINNEQITVPENGSVQRTITNGDGTTQIDVSTNSDSNGNSYSSSFMTSSSNSTSVNSSITTNSQNVTVRTD